MDVEQGKSETIKILAVQQKAEEIFDLANQASSLGAFLAFYPGCDKELLTAYYWTRSGLEQAAQSLIKGFKAEFEPIEIFTGTPHLEIPADVLVEKIGYWMDSRVMLSYFRAKRILELKAFGLHIAIPDTYFKHCVGYRDALKFVLGARLKEIGALNGSGVNYPEIQPFIDLARKDLNI